MYIWDECRYLLCTDIIWIMYNVYNTTFPLLIMLKECPDVLYAAVIDYAFLCFMLSFFWGLSVFDH